EASLKSIFGYHFSANADLQEFVALRYDGLLRSFEPTGAGLTLACVFAPTNVTAIKPPPLALTNQIARLLFEAERMLTSEPERQTEALRLLQVVFEKSPPRAFRETGTVPYYTSLAAKACLRRGETQMAKRFLLRGMEIAPESDVLQYLARVFS